MNKYDTYKESRFKWLNQIPSGWRRSRIKMVGSLFGGLNGKKGSDFNNGDISRSKPFIPFTNISNNTYISKDHFQYVNVEEHENQNRVFKNDLFFLMSSENYDDLGKTSILIDDVGELYLNSFCKGFRIKDPGVFPTFLNYQLMGSLHKAMISVEGNGFTRINLRQDKLLDIPIFIPPILEQKQIVLFLDTKISHIDSLIDKTIQKIELLKEKRISFINEAVTKGLDPNVEIKNINNDWIGGIPSHWEVLKLKRIGKLYGGLTGKSGEDFGQKDNPLNKPFIPFTNISNNTYISKDHFQYVNVEEHENQNRVFKNDLFFLMSSENYDDLGKTSILIDDVGELYLNSFCKGFRITNTKTNPLFLNYQLNGFIFKKLISINGFGFTRINLRQDKLLDINILLPPPKEQKQIVHYLNKKTKLIDISIKKEEKRIKFLKEYKQSLLSEVVSGKKRVV